ncbi:MAG TPA: hypothetical protein DCS93_12440 [Microscillaceae bacterium]|nr:hypothetical protein [Microscillaceae bacterium]
MTIVNKIKHIHIPLYMALIVGLLTTSCKKKEEVTIAPPSINDKIFFSQLKQASDELAKGDIWRGYNFDKMPMYFVHRDAEGTPTQGYLVNPVEPVLGATKVNDTESKGLDVYRYDLAMGQADEQLKAGNGLFDFYYPIGDTDYYLQAYTDEQVGDNWAITVAVHECFHVFQRAGTWTTNSGAVVDRDNYPITQELLSYQLLLLKIAEKMPQETDKAQLRTYLEMYVALREQEMKLDPSRGQLVKFMANNQEEREGSAQYVEYLVSARILSGYTTQRPSFTNINLAQLFFQPQVKQAFSFNIWYGTGAAALYMLASQGVDIETQVQTDKNVYEVAAAYLNMAETQKSTVLEQAKVEFDWASIQKEASRLWALQ